MERRDLTAKSSAGSFPLQRGQSGSARMKTSSMPTWKDFASQARASSSMRAKRTSWTSGWSGQ